MYIADGQNLFEDWLAHQGVSWRAADAAIKCLENGDTQPFIVVGIDSAGVFRSLNYLPYAPGTGVGQFRRDCERWPGGGVDNYVNRLISEYLPLVEGNFAWCASFHSHRLMYAASPRAWQQVWP